MSAFSRNELADISLLYANLATGRFPDMESIRKLGRLVKKQAIACKLPKDELESVLNLAKTGPAAKEGK